MSGELLTISDAAAELGVSRRALDHALAGDGVVKGHEVEEIPATPELLERLGLSKRTKRLVRMKAAAAPLPVFTGEGSRERTLQRLEEFAHGTDGSLKMRMDALVEADKLRRELDERARLYIERGTVAASLVLVGNTIQQRLLAMPPRFAGELLAFNDIGELRARFAELIDETLEEMGDAVQNELAELLGDEASE